MILKILIILLLLIKFFLEFLIGLVNLFKVFVLENFDFESHWLHCGFQLVPFPSEIISGIEALTVS